MTSNLTDPELLAAAKGFLKRFPQAGNDGVEEGLLRAWIRKGEIDKGEDSMLSDCFQQRIIDGSISAARDELGIPEPDLPDHLAFAIEFFSKNRRAKDERCRQAWIETLLAYLGKKDCDYENDHIDALKNGTLIAARQELGLKLDRETVKSVTGLNIDSRLRFLCDMMLRNKSTDAQILKAYDRAMKKGQWNCSIDIEYPITLDDIAVLRDYVAKHHSQMQTYYSTHEVKKLLVRKQKNRSAKKKRSPNQ